MNPGAVIKLLFTFLLVSSTVLAQQEENPSYSAFKPAHMDALTQLVGLVKELRIAYNITIKDFLREDIRRESIFEGFIKKNCKTYSSVSQSDGTNDVTITISVEDVIQELKKINQLYNKKTVWQFDQIRIYHPNPVIKVTRKSNSSPKSNIVPEYWKHVPAQGRLMALRAAKVDAYRNMAELIMGLHINSTTSVRDFVAENDEIRVAFNHFIRGVLLVGSPYYKADGTVEVTAEMTIDSLINELKHIHHRYYYGYRLNEKDFEKVRLNYPSQVIHVKGTGVVPVIYRSD